MYRVNSFIIVLIFETHWSKSLSLLYFVKIIIGINIEAILHQQKEHGWKILYG